MTRPHFTLAHTFMVISGIAAFVGAAQLLADRRETVDVYVAATALQAGSMLNPGDLETVTLQATTEIVASLVPADADIEGQRIGDDIASGEPLLRSDLANVPSTERTYTLEIDPYVISGLGLRSGDLVDVIVAAEDGAAYLATGLRVARLPSGDALGGLGSANNWVTVEVNEAQALLLAEALGAGEVAIVRSSGVANG